MALLSGISEITGKCAHYLRRECRAAEIKKYLAGHSDVEQKLSRGGHIAFYSTAATNKFERLGSVFFGKNTRKTALL